MKSLNYAIIILGDLHIEGKVDNWYWTNNGNSMTIVIEDTPYSVSVNNVILTHRD